MTFKVISVGQKKKEKTPAKAARPLQKQEVPSWLEPMFGKRWGQEKVSDVTIPYFGIEKEQVAKAGKELKKAARTSFETATVLPKTIMKLSKQTPSLIEEFYPTYYGLKGAFKGQNIKEAMTEAGYSKKKIKELSKPYWEKPIGKSALKQIEIIGWVYLGASAAKDLGKELVQYMPESWKGKLIKQPMNKAEIAKLRSLRTELQSAKGKEREIIADKIDDIMAEWGISSKELGTIFTQKMTPEKTASYEAKPWYQRFFKTFIMPKTAEPIVGAGAKVKPSTMAGPPATVAEGAEPPWAKMLVPATIAEPPVTKPSKVIPTIPTKPVQKARGEIPVREKPGGGWEVIPEEELTPPIPIKPTIPPSKAKTPPAVPVKETERIIGMRQIEHKTKMEEAGRTEILQKLSGKTFKTRKDIQKILGSGFEINSVKAKEGTWLYLRKKPSGYYGIEARGKNLTEAISKLQKQVKAIPTKGYEKIGTPAQIKALYTKGTPEAKALASLWSKGIHKGDISKKEFKKVVEWKKTGRSAIPESTYTEAAKRKPKKIPETESSIVLEKLQATKEQMIKETSKMLYEHYRPLATAKKKIIKDFRKAAKEMLQEENQEYMDLSERIKVLENAKQNIGQAEKLAGVELKAVEKAEEAAVAPNEVDKVIEKQAKKAARVLRTKGIGETTFGLRIKEAEAPLKEGMKKDYPHVSDPEVKAVLEAGRKHTIPFIGPIINLGKEVKSEMTRILIFEPGLKKYPQFKNEIRTGLIPTIRRAAEKGEIALGGIFSDLTKSESNVVLDIIGMKDFIERAEAGLELPRSLPLEKVKSELEKLQGKVPDKIKDAANRYWNLNKAIKQDLVKRGVLDPEQGYENYFPHLVLDYMPDWWADSIGFLPRRARISYRPYAKKAVGSVRDISVSKEAIFRHLNAVFLDNMIDDWCKTELNKYDISSRLSDEEKETLFGDKKKPLPNRLYDYKGERYKGYQFIPGRVLFGTEAVSPAILQKAIEDGMTTEEWLNYVGPKGGKPTHKVAALGQYQRVYVVPQLVAERLTKLKSPFADIPFLYTMIHATSIWKRLTLDLAGLPFHLGNIFGDFINLYRTTPRASMEIPRAIHMLRTPQTSLSPEDKDILKLAEEHDVIRSGFVSEYAPILQKSKSPFALIERASNFRENILRLSMFVYQINRAEKGLDMKAPEINVSGLDRVSAAGKIAREFTVDYQAISPAYRRFARGLAAPFMTFYDYNFRNWAKYTRAKPLKFLIKFAAPLIAMWIHNNTGERKEIEENLPEYHRWRPHIILKKLPNDKAFIWSMQTPLDMAASWIGLDKIGDKITRVRAGEMSTKEAAITQLKDMGMGAPNMIKRLANPIIQMFAGLLSNKDPFTNRTIIPERLKGTVEGNKLTAEYVIEKIALPYAQYVNSMRKAEAGDPFINYLFKGPLDIKRALGFYVVDTGTYSYFSDIEKEEDLKAKRQQYLYQIERAYIEGRKKQIPEFIKEAKQMGIEFSSDDIDRRLDLLRVQRDKIKYQLGKTTDQGKRYKLEMKLKIIEKEQEEERKKRLPKAIRDELGIKTKGKKSKSSFPSSSGFKVFSVGD